MTDTIYIDVKDQAKILRSVLREAYPGIRFSVRIDRGGHNVVRIRWTDGPTTKQVDALVQPFTGGGFDGMTDYAYSITRYWKGQPVRFGARFIFTDRVLSPAFVRQRIDRAVAKARPWGADAFTWTIRGEDDGRYGARIEGADDQGRPATIDATSRVHAALGDYTTCTPQPSPTMRHLGTYSHSPDHAPYND